MIDMLRERASVRRFRSEPVSHEIILTMLEAARLAPSGGNEQPWLFGVLTDRELIGKVAALSYKQQWIGRAPLIIVLCAVMVEDERGGRMIQKQRWPELAEAIDALDRELYTALNTEEHQTKIAGSQLALAALEVGVHSTWVSRFDAAKLRDLLRLPPHIIPSEMLVMGYPEDRPRMAGKKSLGEVFFADYYR